MFEGRTLKDRWVDYHGTISLDRDHDAAINMLTRARHACWALSSLPEGCDQEAVGL